MIVAGNGIYDNCKNCGSLVKVNKFVFGSLHYCDPMSANKIKEFKRMQKAQLESKPFVIENIAMLNLPVDTP